MAKQRRLFFYLVAVCSIFSGCSGCLSIGGSDTTSPLLLESRLRAETAKLVEALGDDSYAVREEAYGELWSKVTNSSRESDTVVKYLQERLERESDAEVKQRLEQLIDAYLRPWRRFVVLRKLVGHERAVWSVAFSPDGTILASGSVDNTIRIWNPRTGDCLYKLQGHGELTPVAVAVSPDGKILASGGGDRKVRIWDAKTFTLLRTLQGHTAEITCLAFSPDSKVLVSGAGFDETVRVWNPVTGECLHVLTMQENRFCCSIGFSPDGNLLAAGNEDGKVRLWDSQNWCLYKELENNFSGGYFLAFSPDGTMLATAHTCSKIGIWNPHAGECLRIIDLDGPAWTVVFSPNGDLFVTKERDGAVYVYQPVTGERLGRLQIWPLPAGRSLPRPGDYLAEVRALALTKDGKMLAAAGDEGSIFISGIPEK